MTVAWLVALCLCAVLVWDAYRRWLAQETEKRMERDARMEDGLATTNSRLDAFGAAIVRLCDGQKETLEKLAELQHRLIDAKTNAQLFAGRR